MDATAVLTSTQLMTNTVPLVLIPLPSGASGALVYSASLGDVVNGLLLLLLLCVQSYALWRSPRQREEAL